MFVARSGVTEDSPGTPGEVLNLSNSGKANNPRIALTNPIHVTWEDNASGTYEILYSRSVDNGETFTDPVNLSNTAGRDSVDHELVTDGSSVHVVWVDFKTGNGDIYYRNSVNDNGNSFLTNPSKAPTNLSGKIVNVLASRTPDIDAVGGKVGVTWAVFPTKAADKLGEIIYKQSNNNGNKFGNYIFVSKTVLDSKEPSVDLSANTGVTVAWLDRGGPARTDLAPFVYGVLAVEKTLTATKFSAPVNLSDDPTNPKKTVDQKMVDVAEGGVVVWDPISRRR
jgi:hypothetical protein